MTRLHAILEKVNLYLYNTGHKTVYKIPYYRIKTVFNFEV